MATKDYSSGLLSKVAKFVRNPTKDWSELDKVEPEPEPDSGYSKQSLKEMIERKRQNDFVRRREFDQLRKLRRNIPIINPELAGRPSFFQNSATSNMDERAITLKKIDEIEAQMSRQWWKGKQDEATVQSDSLPPNDQRRRATDESGPPADAAREKAGNFETTQNSEFRSDSESVPRGDGEVTQMGSPEPVGDTPAAPAKGTAMSSKGRKFDAGISEFSVSNLFSIELGDGLADPDLEEAAIRFANGDDAGAEAGLLSVLRAENAPPDSANLWAAALFDLYRATGQQASFDRVAIEYAQRFGHSAPAWFSVPELLGRGPTTSASSQVDEVAPAGHTVWRCPDKLDFYAMQDLQASLSHVAQPWYLNWDRLESISSDAGQALAELFAVWCSQAVRLQFDGASQLEKILRDCTPSGDRGVELYWWQLRLDALRMMRLQDEFELAALDFCVIYEVSPPPWEEPQCEYLRQGKPVSASLPDDELSYDEELSRAHADRRRAATAPTVPMEMEAIPSALVELTGEVIGDAAEALDKIQSGLRGVNRLVISCDRLIRVDFSAAGSILNWVAIREAEGCHVQFRDVPRLVAVFFNVIGINEHARVILRNR
ncbi:MAG: STAS domain-containing protein [Comamonadaceae bacterium]